MLVFHAFGDWTPSEVSTTWNPVSAKPTPQIQPLIDDLIDDAWKKATSDPRKKLFDGPMCRMDAWDAAPQSLRLTLSPTSYRTFLGTNLTHPELADRFGRDVLANPVGVSPTLLTSDGYLLFGCRNASVAYYPNHIHPFAGALEPKDVRTDPGVTRDVFQAVRRELAEELSLQGEHLTEMHCTGIAEDQQIRQPELIFRVTTRCTRSEIEARLDRHEHHATWSVPARPDDVAQAIAAAVAGKTPLPMTPVALAALLLFGRIHFSPDWFHRTAAVVIPPNLL